MSSLGLGLFLVFVLRWRHKALDGNPAAPRDAPYFSNERLFLLQGVKVDSIYITVS